MIFIIQNLLFADASDSHDFTHDMWRRVSGPSFHTQQDGMYTQTRRNIKAKMPEGSLQKKVWCYWLLKVPLTEPKSLESNLMVVLPGPATSVAHNSW